MNDKAKDTNPDKTVDVQPIFVNNSQGYSGYAAASLEEDQLYQDNLVRQSETAQKIWGEKAGIELNFLPAKSYVHDAQFNEFNFGNQVTRNNINRETNPQAVNVIFTHNIKGNLEVATPKSSLFNNVEGSVTAISSQGVNQRSDALAHAVGRGMGLSEKGIYSPIHKENVLDDPKNLMTEAQERQSPRTIEDIDHQGYSHLTKGQIKEARSSPLVKDIEQKPYIDEYNSGQYLKEAEEHQNGMNQNLEQTKTRLIEQEPRLNVLENKVEALSTERTVLQEQHNTLNTRAQNMGLIGNNNQLSPANSLETSIIGDNSDISHNSDQTSENSVDHSHSL